MGISSDEGAAASNKELHHINSGICCQACQNGDALKNELLECFRGSILHPSKDPYLQFQEFVCSTYHTLCIILGQFKVLMLNQAPI